MSTQAVQVSPGGKLIVQGKAGSTTAVTVQAPTIPKPAAPADNTGIVLVTATATLLAAALGQLLAHLWSQQRERKKLLNDRLSAAVDAALDSERRLHKLNLAYAKAIRASDATIVADGASDLVDSTESLSAAWARYAATPGASASAVQLFERIDSLLVLSVGSAIDLRSPLATHQTDKLRDVANRVRHLTLEVVALKAHT